MDLEDNLKGFLKRDFEVLTSSTQSSSLIIDAQIRYYRVLQKRF